MIINLNITGTETQEQLVDKAMDLSEEFQEELVSINKPRAIQAQLYLYSILGRNLLEMFIVNHSINFTKADFKAAKVEAEKILGEMFEHLKLRVFDTIDETEKGGIHTVHKMDANGKPV